MYLVLKLIESYLTHEASFSEVALKVFGQRTPNGRCEKSIARHARVPFVIVHSTRCISALSRTRTKRAIFFLRERALLPLELPRIILELNFTSPLFTDTANTRTRSHQVTIVDRSTSF